MTKDEQVEMIRARLAKVHGREPTPRDVREFLEVAVGEEVQAAAQRLLEKVTS